MEDRLPDINIKVDTSPEEFINRIMQIASNKKELLVNLTRDHLGSEDMIFLNIELISEMVHNGLLGQIISDAKLQHIVNIEVRSRKWNPDPPTYEVYVKAAKTIFENLLKEYNKEYESKYRINIQTKNALEPKLPPKAHQVFRIFEVLANKDCLHPLDWQRFYNFIHHCFSHKVKISEDDVYRLLVSAGFTEQKADHISDIFHHGIRILKRRP